MCPIIPQRVQYITLIAFWEIIRSWLTWYTQEENALNEKWRNTSRTLTHRAAYVPGMAPRLELSKNCFGHLSDIGSEPAWTSKNLLFGESRWYVFLGEFTSFSVNSSGLLVGVRGEWGASFLLSLNLYALFFHSVISSCCLFTRLKITQLVKWGSYLGLNTSRINWYWEPIYLSNCAVFFSSSSIYLSLRQSEVLARGSSPSTMAEKNRTMISHLEAAKETSNLENAAYMNARPAAGFFWESPSACGWRLLGAPPPSSTVLFYKTSAHISWWCTNITPTSHHLQFSLFVKSNSLYFITCNKTKNVVLFLVTGCYSDVVKLHLHQFILHGLHFSCTRWHLYFCKSLDKNSAVVLQVHHGQAFLHMLHTTLYVKTL